MYKSSRTISFLENLDGRPISPDLKRIDFLRTEAMESKGLKKIGFGNFLIKVFREWEILSAKDEHYFEVAKTNEKLKHELAELKHEIAELKA